MADYRFSNCTWKDIYSLFLCTMIDCGSKDEWFKLDQLVLEFARGKQTLAVISLLGDKLPTYLEMNYILSRPLGKPLLELLTEPSIRAVLCFSYELVACLSLPDLSKLWRWTVISLEWVFWSVGFVWLEPVTVPKRLSQHEGPAGPNICHSWLSISTLIELTGFRQAPRTFYLPAI